jgi:hypothetical protein
MKKIISDDGVLLGTFDEFETMKNGNIVLSGYVSSIITNPVIQQYQEPAERPIRKAFKQTIENNKYGLMCPSCHQSRYMEVINPKSKTNPSFLIQDVEGNKYLSPICHGKEWKKKLRNIDLKEYLNRSNLDLEDITFKTIKTLKELSLGLLITNPNIACNICDHVSDAQSWVNEYAVPTSKFHLTCNTCGSEMQIQNEGLGKFDKESMTHTVKCTNKECGFTTSKALNEI